MTHQIVAVEVRPYARELVRKCRFSCGKPDLDDWLKNHAGQQERGHNTRTFLATVPGTDTVVGYYATTTYRLELDDESIAFGAGKHRYPIPAVLLARLAVDSGWAGCGIGRQLLCDALLRIADASRSVGFEVIVVDAIDDEAVTFYLRYGFARFASHPRRLFMTTKDLLATAGSEGNPLL